MEPQNVRRCPHFQIYSESLQLVGPPAYLAIRRCLLTERMIALIEQQPEGALLAQKLVITAGNGNRYAFVGPDLEAVTQRACTIKRCEERCTPAYKINLDRFHVADPREEEVTCDDDAQLPQAVEREVQSRDDAKPHACIGK